MFITNNSDWDILKIGIIADKSNQNAIKAEQDFKEKYFLESVNENNIGKFNILLVLGGDGFMLHTIHKYFNLNLSFYGINFGHFGFLLNKPHEKINLLKRIKNCSKNYIHPLKMEVKKKDGMIINFLAFNEISLLRASRQSAKIKIIVNNIVRINELVCDGVLVATAAGSTAYNSSVGGPILPLESNLLALTPISPFIPKKWSGALLKHNSIIEFIINDSVKRPVNAVADFHEVEDIHSVIITEDKSRAVSLLFDNESNLEERIIKEQFYV